MPAGDRRRSVPRTDRVLGDERVAPAVQRLGRSLVLGTVREVLERVRGGELEPEEAVPAVLRALPATAGSMRPVLNATGVLLHTNIGRAPLSTAAVQAVCAAAGTSDIELDLATGDRGPRGRGAVQALAAAVPAAGGVHVVNNGAAALVLAATALAAGREILIARGEMVEIGDGFRLPDLLTSTGARLREVGTTNRVSAADYEQALGPGTGMVLKVHPSNFVVRGFTGSVSVDDLSRVARAHGVPLVHDIGSGLLAPHPALPEEPDAATSLRQGADLVTCSADKLLGGPQAGLLLGRADLVQQLRRYPLARALRVDKLTLAALEATLRGPTAPVLVALGTTAAQRVQRAARLADVLRSSGVQAEVVESVALVGGGGAPEVPLPSAAVAIAADWALPLRTGDPAVLGTLTHGRLLLDVAALDPAADDAVVAAVLAVASSAG